MAANILMSCETNKNADSNERIVYFEDGKTIRQKINYKNGLKNGLAIEYFNNGAIKAKRYYLNDSLNDSSVVYFKDGRPKSLHFYKNKLKSGCWKEYNKEGKLFSEIYFKNGLLDSTSTVYTYRTGKVLTRMVYKDGYKNGLDERYYSNGKPKSKSYFHLGKPCYGTEEWQDNGKKINNDFKISIVENNEVSLKNKLSYIIKLENPHAKDEVYKIISPGKGNLVGDVFPLLKVNDHFILEFDVDKGGFVMETVDLVAYRETRYKNTYIKKISFNASTNNF